MYLNQIILTTKKIFVAVQRNFVYLSPTSIIPTFTGKIIYNFFWTFGDSSKELLSELHSLNPT